MEDIRCLMNVMNRIFKKRLLLDEFLEIFEYCNTHYDFTESNWGMLSDDDPFWLNIIDNYRKYGICESCNANSDKNPKKRKSTVVLTLGSCLILCRDCYEKLNATEIFFQSDREVLEYLKTQRRLKTKC